MRTRKWSFAVVSAAVFAAAALLINVQLRIVKTAQRLERQIGETVLAAERTEAKIAARRADIRRALTELSSFGELPVTLARDAESVKAAIEQCALATQSECLISAAETAQECVVLDVAVKTSPLKAAAFLKKVMERRELFVLSQLEQRSRGDGTVSLEAKFFAFLERSSQKGETP